MMNIPDLLWLALFQYYSSATESGIINIVAHSSHFSNTERLFIATEGVVRIELLNIPIAKLSYSVLSSSVTGTSINIF